MFRVVLALLLMACFAAEARAERRVALVIGNAAYSDAPELRNPRNDAQDIAKALTGLGFEVTTGQDLTGLQLTRMVAAFTRSLQGADVALFYYAGHGIQASDQNYLIPVDAKIEDEFGLKREAVALSDVIGGMESGAKTSLVFLDACRDNPFVERLKRSLAGNRSTSIGRGLARMDLGSADTLLVFSTAPGQVAADGTGRNSPFTTAFLANIATPGVEIESVMKRVTASVRTLTHGEQEPERLSRLSTEFYFAKAEPPLAIRQPVPTPAPGSSDDAAKAFEVAKSINTVEAWDSFLKAFPTGIYADFARDLRAQLAAKTAPVPAAIPTIREPVPAKPAQVVTTEPPPVPETPPALSPTKTAPRLPLKPVIRRPVVQSEPVIRRPARIVRERPRPSGGGGACFIVNGEKVCG